MWKVNSLRKSKIMKLFMVSLVVLTFCMASFSHVAATTEPKIIFNGTEWNGSGTQPVFNFSTKEQLQFQLLNYIEKGQESKLNLQIAGENGDDVADVTYSYDEEGMVTVTRAAGHSFKSGNYTIAITAPGASVPSGTTVPPGGDDGSEVVTEPIDALQPEPADQEETTVPQEPADTEVPADLEEAVDPEEPVDPEVSADPEETAAPEQPVDPEPTTPPEDNSPAAINIVFTYKMPLPVIKYFFNGSEKSSINPDTCFNADQEVRIEISTEGEVNSENAKVTCEGISDLVWAEDESKEDVWFTTFSLTEGDDYTISTSFTDTENNTVSSNLSAFSIDTTAPSLKFYLNGVEKSLEDKEYFVKDLKIKVTDRNFDAASSIVEGQNIWPNTWRQEGEDTWTMSFDFILPFQRTLQVTAKDKAGNSATGGTKAPFMGDSLKPDIDFFFNDALTDKNNLGEYYKADQTVKIRITEDNFDPALVTVKLNDTPVEEIIWTTNGKTSEYTLPQLKKGDKYSLSVTCEDKAGNSAVNDLGGKKFTIDTDTPLIRYFFNGTETALASLGKYYTSNQIVKIEITEHNFNASKAIVKGKGITPGSWVRTPNSDVWTMTLNLSDGNDYTLSANCTDEAGNAADGGTSAAFTIDTKLPVIKYFFNGRDTNLANLERYYVTDQTIKIEVQEVNFNPSKAVVNGNGIVTKDWVQDSVKKDIWTMTLALKEGDNYTLTSQCTDEAGLKTEGAALTEFSIDTKNPEIRYLFNGIETDLSKLKRYYNKDQKVEIEITEHNFNAEKAVVTGHGITTEGKVWERKAADSDVWTMTLDLQEGDNYTLSVSCIDEAKRSDSGDNLTAFTVDTIAPVIKYFFNGTETNLSNLKRYYGADQEIKIEIVEHNFNAQKAAVAGSGINSGSWIKDASKKDTWTMTLNLSDGNDYTLSADCKDEADHISDGDTLTAFTVDTKKPVIKYFFNAVGTDLNNLERYYSEDQVVKIEVTEVNFNPAKAVVSGTGIKPENWIQDPVKAELWTMTLALKEGDNYNLTSQCIDEADHEGKGEALTQFTIDTTIPVIKYYFNGNETNINNLNRYYSNNQQIEIQIKEHNFNAEKAAVIGNGISSDNKVWVRHTEDSDLWTMTLNLTEGDDYTLYAGCIDEAKHEGKGDNLTAFTIDTTAPIIKYYFNNTETYSSNLSRYYGESQAVRIEIIEHNFDEHSTTVTGAGISAAGWVRDGSGADLWSMSMTLGEGDDYTLKAATTDRAGHSQTGDALAAFSIDTTPPIIEYLFNGEKTSGDNLNRFYNKDQSVTVRVIEHNFNPAGATVKLKGYPQGGLNWKSTGDVREAALPILKEGDDYTLETVCIDLAAHSASDNLKGKAFTIDTTAPAIQSYTFSDTPTNIVNNLKYYNKNQSITLKIKEHNFNGSDVKVALTKEGGTAVAYNRLEWTKVQGQTDLWQAVINNLPQADKYKLDMSYTDLAVNETVEKPRGEYFTIDTTAPIIQSYTFSVAPTNTLDGMKYFNQLQPINQTIRIKEHNFDPKDVKVTLTKENGKVVNSNNLSWVLLQEEADVWQAVITDLQEADNYHFEVDYIDLAKNSVVEKPTPEKFTIDRTAPKITENITTSTGKLFDGVYYFKDSFKAELHLDKEGIDRFDYITINGAADKENINVFITDGVYEVKARAIDNAGNKSEEITVKLTIDKTNPAISVLDLINGYFKGELNPKIRYSDTNLDLSKVSIKLNDKELGSGSGSTVGGYEKGFNVKADGKYDLNISVADKAGNISTQKVKFVLDNSKPEIIIENKISGKAFNNDWKPDISVMDDNEYDVVSCTLNGTEYDAGNPVTQEGKNVLFFEVKDKAGNVESLSYQFVIDKTPPKIIAEDYITKKLVAGNKFITQVNLRIYIDYAKRADEAEESEKITTILLNGKPAISDVVEIDGKKIYTVALTDFNSYTLEVEAADEVENIAKESIAFQIVDKSIFVKFYENKPLFYSGIAVLLTLLIAAVTIGVRHPGKTGKTGKTEASV
jgi:predicted DNA binding CopG/RHH family protein